MRHKHFVHLNFETRRAVEIQAGNDMRAIHACAKPGELPALQRTLLQSLMLTLLVDQTQLHAS